MSLKNLIEAIESDLPRYARAFARVRDCSPSLAAYERASDLARTMGDDTVSTRRRSALAKLATTEAQKPDASPVWASLLALAFSPMLYELRARIGHPSDEDLDSLVLVAFFTTVRTAPVGPYLWIALRRVTAREVVRRCLVDRRLDTSTEFDDEIHGVDVFGRDDDAVKRDTLARLEAQFGSEVFDVLVATRGTGVSLKEYVESTCPDRRLRARRYEQVRAARLRLERSIRDRLKARAA